MTRAVHVCHARGVAHGGRARHARRYHAGVHVRWIPLLGPFHRLLPRYNAVTVLDLLRRDGSVVTATTAVVPGAWADPLWQDVEEPALQVAVVPWARRSGRTVHAVGAPSEDPRAAADAVRYLREAGAASDVVHEIDAADDEVRRLLQRPMDLDAIVGTLLPAIARAHELRTTAFGDGPGTDWLAQRCNLAVDRLLALGASEIDVLAPIDHLPALLADDRVRWVPPSTPHATDEAQRRALLDGAMHRGGEEPHVWLERLAELDGPEARWIEADVWLRAGHAAEALERLRALVAGEFGEPSHVPGLALARLGQLADLDGRRDEARRAYRGVLALPWAPQAAREVARSGLDTPFTFQD